VERRDRDIVNQVVKMTQWGSIARYCSIMKGEVMVHLIHFNAAYCTRVLEFRARDSAEHPSTAHARRDAYFDKPMGR